MSPQSAEARFSGTVNRRVHSSHMYADTLHTHFSLSTQGALAYLLPLQQSRDADGRPGGQRVGAPEAGRAPSCCWAGGQGCCWLGRRPAGDRQPWDPESL